MRKSDWVSAKESESESPVSIGVCVRVYVRERARERNPRLAWRNSQDRERKAESPMLGPYFLLACIRQELVPSTIIQLSGVWT